MRPSSMERFRVNSPRPAYQANAENVNEGIYFCSHLKKIVRMREATISIFIPQKQLIAEFKR